MSDTPIIEGTTGAVACITNTEGYIAIYQYSRGGDWFSNGTIYTTSQGAQKACQDYTGIMNLHVVKFTLPTT